MAKFTFKIAYLIILSSLTFSCQTANIKSDSIEFVTSDIHNFYDMLSQLEKANSKSDSLLIIKNLYLNKVSIGLNEYLEYEQKSNQRNINEEYFNIIKSYPKYFQSQKQIITDVQKNFSKYKVYFRKIKEVYPKARFLPTYFSIGFFNTQGQVVPPNTIFVGLEASIRDNSTDFSEFSDRFSWLINDKISYRDLGYLIVHENIHTFQKYKSAENSILDHSILEGAAVFLTQYFCGEESLIGIAGVDNEMIEYAEKKWNKSLERIS